MDYLKHDTSLEEQIGQAAKTRGIGLQTLFASLGLPFSSKARKLYETLHASKRGQEIAMGRRQLLQDGKVLGKIETAQRALEYYCCEDFPERLQKKQLSRAWSLFEESYDLVKCLSDYYGKFQPKVALSVAICHKLLNHNGHAKEWANIALNDNKHYLSLEESDLKIVENILNNN